MSKDHLATLFSYAGTNQVKTFLLDNPAFNVNEALDGMGWTALHHVCRNDHHEIVSVLLVHLDVDVNLKDNNGWTPFLLACLSGNVEVVKVLLRDSRVNINMDDDLGGTALWYASYNRYIEVIKWMNALRGDELDFDKKGRSWDGEKECTAIEIARHCNNREVVSLLEKLVEDPTQTRYEIRAELGIREHQSAELFATIVYLCDDHLEVKQTNLENEPERFFSITKRLPMELQMIICHRVYGSCKDAVLKKDSELAFSHLGLILHQEMERNNTLTLSEIFKLLWFGK